MLILIRAVGESVKVGEGITVTVVAVKGSDVRIGIEAPREIAVHRKEVVERIKREAKNKGDDAT